ncbi:PucR family transcriptional regulator [Nocardia brasiliensis]
MVNSYSSCEAAVGSTVGPHVIIKRLEAMATDLISKLAAGAQRQDTVSHTLMAVEFVVDSELNIRLFYEFARSGSEPPPAATQPLVDRAVELVRNGIDFGEMLTNYRLGVTFLWSQLIDALSPDEGALTPSELPYRLNDYLGLITTRIATAVVADAYRSHSEAVEPRQAVAAALLNGYDPFEVAHTHEIVIAERFLIAVIRLARPSPGDLAAIRAIFDAVPGAFLQRDRDGWTALVPHQREVDEDGAIASVNSLLEPRSGIGPDLPSLWVGVAIARHVEIPAAYAEARTVAEIAQSMRWPKSVCHRRQMMFEYMVATARPAHKMLAALVTPLADHPVLRQTLELFVDRQSNVNSVAREAFIHRNTVVYRLNRVAELTGLDPQLPSECAILMAALTAERLRSTTADT